MNKEYFSATLTLQAALNATKKSVKIEIAQDDLRTLKDGVYKLCFAKKVAEGNYNVVWQSYDDYSVTNAFSWTPQYQLFGSNHFKENVEVEVTTNVVDIGIGEESTLDKYCILSAPKTGKNEAAITMINDYKSIHPGINQLSTGIDGKQVSTPIYLAPNEIVMGEVTLTPVESVQVWFEQNIQTSAMFSNARSNSIEINLTNSDSTTRRYEKQKWITP